MGLRNPVPATGVRLFALRHRQPPGMPVPFPSVSTLLRCVAPSIQPLGEAAIPFKRCCLGFQLAVKEIAAQVQQGQRGVGLKLCGESGVTRTRAD